MTTPTSHCGCFMAEGCWGSGGWHFRLMTFDDLPRGIKQWQDENGKWVQVSGEERESLEHTYKDKALAFERCPAYWGSRDRNRGTVNDILGQGRAA